MKSIITIPFTSFSNIRTENNSGQLETADNVYHDLSGYKPIKELSSDGTSIIDWYANGNLGSMIAGFSVGADDFYGSVEYNILVIYTLESGAEWEIYTSVGVSDTWTSRGTIAKSSTSDFIDFIKWGTNVIAVSGTMTPLILDLTNVGAGFVTLTGSPPPATTCCVVDDFVLFANTYEGAAWYRSRIWNSAINDETGWTAGTNLADYDDNPELGYIYKIVGGQYATVFAEHGIAIMQRVGGEVGWQIDVVEYHAKKISPASVISVGNQIYYAANTGFYRFDGQISHLLSPENYETEVDISKFDFPFILMSAHDPDEKCIIWSYGTLTQIVYNYKYDQFTTITPTATGVSGATNARYQVMTGIDDNIFKPLFIGFDSTNTQYNVYSHGTTDLTPDVQTGFYELIPNQWATITRVDTIAEGVTSENIDILAYDDTKTLIDTVTVSDVGGGKLRQTGRYFKFQVQSDFSRLSGLKIEYIGRGKR